MFDRELLQRLNNLQVDLLLQDELNHPSLAFVNARIQTHLSDRQHRSSSA